MALTAGTRLGPYEITAPIGEGGMGQVYRATDTMLGRQVAIKILPDAFASDPERLARFEREAKTLAALNHPHIAAIYAIEQSTGQHALVMELVEGEDLSQRIARGAIPIDDALLIAGQIAEALEAAHEQGIVHRDLKPANIKVRDDGTVKVLDFGLAKAMEPGAAGGAAGADHAVSQLATITTPAMTQAGTILGTAAYMSPEQAKGRTADRRSDVWAFGCVLYEMLTGRRAFPGDGVAETLAAVIRGEPDWAVLPAAAPASIARLLRRCLAKDPRQRLPELQTARLDIVEARATTGAGSRGAAAAVSAGGGTRVAWVTAAACALAGIVAVAMLLGRSDPPAPEVHVEISTPPTTDPASFALSPDGRMLAFVATAEGRPRLWLRSLEDGSTRVLAGTDLAAAPFWSPDGRTIGFGRPGGVARVDVADGTVQPLFFEAGADQRADWSTQNVVVLSPTRTRPLLRFDVGTSATPVPFTELVRQQAHRDPRFLPDGRRVLFLAVGPPEVSGLYMASLDGGEPRRLAPADSGAALAAGHLLFARQGALVAQPFDEASATFSGEPFRLFEAARVEGDEAAPVDTFAISTSASGTVAFRPIRPPGEALVWFDRAGKELARIADSQTTNNPELSRDGRRLLARRIVNGQTNVWALDIERGSWTPLANGAQSSQPLWSPDGRRIAFQRNLGGSLAFFVKDAALGASEERVFVSPYLKKPLQWSPDGRYLLFTSQREDGTDNDILALPLTGDRQPIRLTHTTFIELDARFSPDGRWIAYQSNETGRFEVWAQPFPGPGDRVQITTDGGAQVQWGPGGRELFYVALDDRMMTVPIALSPDGRTLRPGQSMPLFQTRIAGGALTQQGGSRQQYVVSPDGQRFLIRTLVDDVAPPPIHLILNWNPALRRTIPPSPR